MPSLLLDREEKHEPSLIQLEVNDKHIPLAQEIQESIETTVSDLPLGKALHLLLHVHSHVFDKAVQTIRSSDPARLLLARADSPTIRAILSIQHYLVRNDINASFHHVYGPLKEKILKKSSQQSEAAMAILSYLALYSKETAEAVQAYLKAELSLDKRSQLACILVIQFLSALDYQQSFAASVMPLLIDIADSQNKPTLLTCTAAELIIQLLTNAIQPTSKAVDNNKLVKSKIEIIEQDDSDTPYQTLDKLLDILLKWHPTPGQAELAAFRELKLLTKSAHSDSWRFILNYLTPKAVISDRPISIKKQKKIISHPNESSSKLILLTMLQKSEWTLLFKENPSKLLSTEQQEIKDLIQSEFKQVLSIQSLYILLPVLVSAWPWLFSCELIEDSRLIQAILDRADNVSDIPTLMPMILKSPESSVCHALMNTIQLDTESRAEFSYQLLTSLVEHHAEHIMPILEPNLLSVIKTSNKACELLIHCMSFMRLPLLIQKLMKMAVESKENEKEKMICIALISKALLHDTWRQDSILYYIDLLRLVEARQEIVEAAYPVIQSPKDISTCHRRETQQADQQEIASLIKSVLIAPVQLWSSRIDSDSFKSCLKQLVRYSYGIPKDTVCIEAWINLRFGLMQHQELVWTVIEECVGIMKQQPILTEELINNSSGQARNMKESILFLRLNPLLILQTIPQQAYQQVCLPKSYIDIKPSIQAKADKLKIATVTTSKTQLAIELADELLYRSCEPPQLHQDLHNPVEFATTLFNIIFCTS